MRNRLRDVVKLLNTFENQHKKELPSPRQLLCCEYGNKCYSCDSIMLIMAFMSSMSIFPFSSMSPQMM